METTELVWEKIELQFWNLILPDWFLDIEVKWMEETRDDPMTVITVEKKMNDWESMVWRKSKSCYSAVNAD